MLAATSLPALVVRSLCNSGYWGGGGGRGGGGGGGGGVHR